jgi:hypothetical protein
MIKNLGIKHIEELLLLLGTLTSCSFEWLTLITGFRRGEKHKGACRGHTKDPSPSAGGTKLILLHAANFILWIWPFLNNNDWRGLGCFWEDISLFCSLLYSLFFLLYGICKVDTRSLRKLGYDLWCRAIACISDIFIDSGGARQTTQAVLIEKQILSFRLIFPLRD